MDCRKIAVIWIDWYAYHVARLRALSEHSKCHGKVYGIELVGGCGVHGNLNFRCEVRDNLPITTLCPAANWREAAHGNLALYVWRALSALNPTHVFVPGYYNLPALGAALWAKRHRRRAVLMSETTRLDHKRRWYKELLKRLLIRGLFDGAIVGGKRHESYLLELGFQQERIARCYDVVDNDYYANRASAIRATRRRDVEGLPEKYFLFVGRLAPEKNVHGLLRSFARYCAGGGDWSLVLAGDGPLRDGLEDQVRRAGISGHVRFMGMKDSDELVTLYAFAACFVLPSVVEPWGLVVNEAMASGLPVIVSNQCGCVDDLVEQGGNGFSFDPDAGNQLTSLLWQVANLSENALRRMGSRSKAIIAGYSLETWANEAAKLATA